VAAKSPVSCGIWVMGGAWRESFQAAPCGNEARERQAFVTFRVFGASPGYRRLTPGRFQVSLKSKGDSDMKTPGVGLSEIEFDVPEPLRPSTMRRFGVMPPLDAAIDALPPVTRPLWRRIAVGLLLTYRRLRPASIGNRCVFEPSCSRFSELAFRSRSFPDATRLTLSRLHRCRPGRGGTDLEGVEIPE